MWPLPIHPNYYKKTTFFHTSMRTSGKSVNFGDKKSKKVITKVK